MIWQIQHESNYIIPHYISNYSFFWGQTISTDKLKLFLQVLVPSLPPAGKLGTGNWTPQWSLFLSIRLGFKNFDVFKSFWTILYVFLCFCHFKCLFGLSFSIFQPALKSNEMPQVLPTSSAQGLCSQQSGDGTLGPWRSWNTAVGSERAEVFGSLEASWEKLIEHE